MHFITFYTDGSDGTLDLRLISNSIIENLSPYFKSATAFNKKDLKSIEGSSQFCNNFPNPLPQNKGANKIGYFDFKGFLIREKLKAIPEGDIVLYHDGNFEKNPQYWQSDWPNISNIIDKMISDNNSDIFVQFEREGVFVKNFVKPYTIETLFPDLNEKDRVRNSLLINAARIAVKNTPFGREFIDDYIELCLRKDLLAPEPIGVDVSDFQWSCGDQDVLNCLIYRYILDGKLHSRFPMYSFLYRILRFENRPFFWQGRDHYTGVSILN